MRPIKRKNVETVYSAINSYYKMTNDWNKKFTFKEIQDRLPKNWDRKCIYRHLNTLMNDEKPQRVFRDSRGQYTTDFAIKRIDENRQAFTQVILSIQGPGEIKGEVTQIINGQKNLTPTINPIEISPEKTEVFKHVAKWRQHYSKNEEIIDAEANAWTRSFINTLSYDVKTGDAPIRLRPDSLITSGEKTGLNAFIFRKAMEIMMELLESIDLETLKKEKNPSYMSDAQLSVTITFNPALFYCKLKYWRDWWERELNREEIHIPGRGGRQFIPLEKIEKHVFYDVFKDEPNSLFVPRTQPKETYFKELSNIAGEIPENAQDELSKIIGELLRRATPK